MSKGKAKQSKRKKQRQKGKRRRGISVSEFPKPFPQYCVSGIFKKGFGHRFRGRKEFELKIYIPETLQVFFQRTLRAKAEERAVDLHQIRSVIEEMPKGIFTGETEFMVPELVEIIHQSGHHYLALINSSAGRFQDELDNFDWDLKSNHEIFVAQSSDIAGIGALYSANIEDFESKELGVFLGAAAIFSLEARLFDIEDDEISIVNRFFIGDRIVKGLSLGEIMRFLSDYWGQDIYAHPEDLLPPEDIWDIKSQVTSDKVMDDPARI